MREQKEEVKKGNYAPWDFEEEDFEEDDKNGIFIYEDSNFIYNESDTHCIEVISKNQYVKSK